MRASLAANHVAAIKESPWWEAPVAWPHDGGKGASLVSGETIAALYRRLGLNMRPTNAVFKDGICYATGEVTLVMISKATKRSAEIPRDIRHKLEALRLHKTDKPIILTADL